MLKRGNYHTTQDSMLSDMNHIWLMKVITPKVQGTINVVSALCLTRSYLDFFIMCSSSAGVIANRGQANYAATNTFLDVFACQLMTGGYPATSISLGSVFSEGWYVENQPRLSIALAYRALWEDLTFSILEYRINPAWGVAQSTQTCHTVVGIRSARDFQRQSIPLLGFMTHSLFSPRRAIAGRSQMAEQEVEAAVDVVTRAIVDKLARIMALSVQEIDPQRSLGWYEVDSLVTVDLRTWFEREVGVSIGSGELLAELAMTQLARQAADGSQFLPAELGRS
ncbi:hypothetical protein ASPTUDRAFT_878123 [Aspergillus tubingensis CBS 134.48]|uniref:Polyketide synthase-like phosphopantetheine-binding domain-containing protein n=1 Tax=Aspergillus tubingensis (strain CBS 134.48) TaxID=767770 RepID=A0A1L9MR26_ASPTC|nr:hypothetical protein ASPTUDRAFT_878123 [Aspergillus tubingensis CBS 134.48]